MVLNRVYFMGSKEDVRLNFEGKCIINQHATYENANTWHVLCFSENSFHSYATINLGANIETFITFMLDGRV